MSLNKELSVFSSAKYDLPAALVVFLVALPLCLGVALASGAPLFSGIVAGAIGGIVVGLLSNSPLSVSGPAAGLTVIVLAAIQKLPSYEAFLLAVLLCGAIQILLGVIKAGIIGEFIPSSVIKGMLTAIGLILILKQIPHAFGYDKDYEGDMTFDQADGENTFSELIHFFNNAFSWGAATIALLGIGILMLWERPFFKKNPIFSFLPGPLVVVAMGILLNQFFQQSGSNLAIAPEHLVKVPVAENFGQFLGQFKFPDFSQIMNKEVWVIAVTLAIVASLESLLSIEAIDKLDPFKRVTNTNRELMAQGAGNTIAGLIGGMPVTSVIVRSSANVNSGGRTKLATIVHGSMLLLSVYFVPNILNKIPLAALAAILLMTGYKLAKPSLFKEMWAKGRPHFVPFVVTVLAILFTDLLKGILVGILVGAHYVFYANFKSAIAMTQKDNDYHVDITQDLSFVNKAKLKKTLDDIPEGANVVIDISKVDFVDLDNAEIIENFCTAAQFKDITVEVKKSPNHNLTTIS